MHNATVKDIIPIFKDYAGMHGYQITYQNDQSGSYHLSLGNVYVPYTSQTIKSKSTYQTPAAPDQPMTAYEQTTWNTVAQPGHITQANAAVSIVQQGEDVLINIDTNETSGPSLDDINDYFKSLGYTSERK